MSSGIYSALSGAKARMEMLDTLSHNMANMKTPGFKKGRNVFEAALSQAQTGNGTQGINFANIRDGFSDFSQGVLTRTGQPFDLAITDEGMFKMVDGQGNFFYTRQGNFNIDAEGHLIGGGQFMLVDEGGKPIVVEGRDGTISEDGTLTMASGGTAKIPLYKVDDPTAFQRIGGAFFTLSGAEPTLVENPKLLQGSIEESNVNVMQEMGRLVEAMRVFETSQRAIKTYDNLAAKAIEIGTLG